MDEKELKTSPKQRFWIIVIAVLMVGSIIASYAAIVISGSSSSSSTTDSTEIDPAKAEEYLAAFQKETEEFGVATAEDFAKFIPYKSEITAYNETAANENGVQVRDLVEGTGANVMSDGSNYLAYYVGWCADESIFDSSFNDDENPTAFSMILDPSGGLIDGWNTGVEGMKIGGIREITIPGEQAYGSSREICGGTNKPLKFLVMAMAKEDPLETLSEDLNEAYMRYVYYAQYGIDYDSLIVSD